MIDSTLASGTEHMSKRADPARSRRQKKSSLGRKREEKLWVCCWLVGGRPGHPHPPIPTIDSTSSTVLQACG
jgi:hypothetical protein